MHVVMGDKDKISRTGMENLSLDGSRFSRDLLTRFMESGWREGKEGGFDEDDEDEKIELNLGLSLGGRFGVDKCSTKLLRATSIAECLPFVKNEDDSLTVSPSPVANYSKLVRTNSLPLESEEWRKRKELQSLRRMEAKRRRSEKQRNLLKEVAAPAAAPAAALPPTSAIKGVVGVANNKGKGMHDLGQILLSQGSVESQGGGGSSSSELDNRSSLRGSRSCGDASQSLRETNNQETGSSGTKSHVLRTSSLDAPPQNPQKPSDTPARNQQRAEDMPYVFTKGDGPNGRRVDGILYKFGRGEDVRIMCVCHGSFHSPAGFVKHAGGTDITHPLKHIVMNPNSAPLT